MSGIEEVIEPTVRELGGTVRLSRLNHEQFLRFLQGGLPGYFSLRRELIVLPDGIGATERIGELCTWSQKYRVSGVRDGKDTSFGTIDYQGSEENRGGDFYDYSLRFGIAMSPSSTHIALQLQKLGRFFDRTNKGLYKKDFLDTWAPQSRA